MYREPSLRYCAVVFIRDVLFLTRDFSTLILNRVSSGSRFSWKIHIFLERLISWFDDYASYLRVKEDF